MCQTAPVFEEVNTPPDCKGAASLPSLYVSVCKAAPVFEGMGNLRIISVYLSLLRLSVIVRP